jgi:copper homeostasis protein
MLECQVGLVSRKTFLLNLILIIKNISMSNMSKYILEACVGSFREAKSAEEKGAHRVELCDNLAEGGTTPSYGTIYAALNFLNLDVSVMIRPRGGNFVYSKEEVEIMKKDIEACKTLGAQGVVCGVLTKDKQVDLNLLEVLVQQARPMSVTFHMAFDEVCGDLLTRQKEVLDQLVEVGVDRVLTKGGTKNAEAGKENLKALIGHADRRITIMPGGGVSEDNYLKLAEYTGATQLHGTKIVGRL